jgi:hypothetical protein
MHKTHPVRKILGGLAVAVVLLILAECGARILISIQADLAPVPDPGPKLGVQLSRERGWEAKPGYQGFTFRSKRRYDHRGLLTIDGKQIDEGTTNRILVIGDSNSFAFRALNKDGYPEQLDRLLPSHAVINLAFPGYSSLQGLQTLRLWAEQLNPSIIIASFNFNDRRYVLEPGAQDSLANFKATAARPTQPHPLTRLALFKILKYAATKTGLITYEDKDAPYDLGTFIARVPPDAYRANLQNIADLARERGARLIFVVLNDNPHEVGKIRIAAGLIENGDAASATKILTVVMDESATYAALARKFLSRAYEQMNETGKAEDARQMDAVHEAYDGGWPLHLDVVYNEIMREVAIERSVEISEAGRVLNDADNVYFDFCHFNEHGHGLVAQQLAAIIRGTNASADQAAP